MQVEQKTALTLQEAIKAAYFHHCRGYPQHLLAEIAFDGINQGRVNEACVLIERALKQEGYTNGLVAHHD